MRSYPRGDFIVFKLRAAIAAVTCGGLMLAASAAAADPVNIAEMTTGYTYFNRPGATLEAHNKAVAACVIEASKTRSFDEQVTAVYGILGAILENALDTASHRASVAASLEDCMVIQGWRVVKVSDAEGQALAALSPEALAERLTPWIGADAPQGQIVRVWGNDAANAVNKRFEVRPSKTVDGQLSLKAVTAASLKQFNPLYPKPVPGAKLDPKWPKKPLKPADLGKAPEGSAVIMVQVKGLSMRNGIGMIFNRMGPDIYTFPSAEDHAPDLLFAVVGLIGAKKEGNMIAVVVPPGRWRVYGMGISPVMNFCLGSPSFEVKAGEIVYAGSYDLGSSDLTPSMDLAPATAWLAGAGGDRLKAASYTNGSRGMCGDNVIYALEFKDAPFEPDYALGSKAVDGSTVAPPTKPDDGSTPSPN